VFGVVLLRCGKGCAGKTGYRSFAGKPGDGGRLQASNVGRAAARPLWITHGNAAAEADADSRKRTGRFR